MKTNTVVTWHVPTPEMAGAEPGYQELIKLWKTSWAKNGWNTAVIGTVHAKVHPLYRPLVGKIRELPTPNGRNYETGCWVRWTALADLTRRHNIPIVMADSDTINYSFKPEVTEQFDKDVHVLDRFGVPCLVYATPRGAQWLVEQMVSWQPDLRQGHFSDMLFFIKELVEPGRVEHGPWVSYAFNDNNFPDWQNAQCVHFSAHSCRGQGMHKVNAIKAHQHGQNGELTV